MSADLVILPARPPAAPIRPSTDPEGSVCHPQYRNVTEGWCIFCAARNTDICPRCGGVVGADTCEDCNWPLRQGKS